MRAAGDESPSVGRAERRHLNLRFFVLRHVTASAPGLCFDCSGSTDDMSSVDVLLLQLVAYSDREMMESQPSSDWSA